MDNNRDEPKPDFYKILMKMKENKRIREDKKLVWKQLASELFEVLKPTPP